MTTLNPFLRNVLIVDAAVSGGACLAMIGGADLTHDLLGLPSGLLFWAGVSLIPFVAALVMILRSRSASAVPAIIATNFVWVAGSLFVAFGSLLAPSLIGQVFVCAQAAMVLLFAELEIIGLRRPQAIA